MKKVFIFLAVLLSTYGGNIATAQVNVSINIGSQPVWGPTGYDNAQYYYLPDADAYYDINRRVFMYQEGNRWVSGPALPGNYRNIDLYNTHKVVINERDPWLHNNNYRSRYAQYRGKHDQQAIRDSREEKYYQNPGHPQYQQWSKQHGNPHQDGQHDNGRHEGNDRGNGNRDEGHHDNGRH